MDESVNVAARKAASDIFDAFNLLPVGLRLQVADELVEEQRYMALIGIGEAVQNDDVKRLSDSIAFDCLVGDASELIEVLSDTGIWGVVRDAFIDTLTAYREAHPDRQWWDHRRKPAGEQGSQLAEEDEADDWDET